MSTQMKLLDWTLISMLAGLCPLASAQESVLSQPAKDADPAQAMDCDDDVCSDEEGLVFRLRTRSYAKPVTHGTDKHSSSVALEPDRRVTVATEQSGQASALGRFSLTLPNGGAIWATEDPNLGQPELSISAPSTVPFAAGHLTAPVTFLVRGNYTAFVQRMEVALYRATDGDLIEPIAIVPMDVAAITQADWIGELSAKYRLRAGDEIVYVLRVYGEGGSFDETYPRRFQLVTPEEAERGNRALRDRVEQSVGSRLTIEQAQTQNLLDNAFAENSLRQQNIPIYGSRIRIQGRNIPQDRILSINGEAYPVDMERKFVAEYLVPLGKHSFDIGLRGGDDTEPQSRYALDVDVSGRYFFGIGLADVTISQNDVSGSAAPFANDSRYRDDVISDGRLAFYLKAKARGKYLITAQADTTERDLEHLFDGFTQADPRDIFRRLDPDLYYPVYGDDSTTYRDVDTMGRFYLRVDWDKNQALWGNYQTGITGTEYAQYVRSLYGAAASWRSRRTNAWGDPGTEARAFGSQAETAPGHNEFLGTGGSLYYLRHTDILPGSDVVVLEIRDASTGRVESRVPLHRGADYEIDEIQGRILLTRTLAQVTRENVPTLTRDVPLDGFEQRLVVDYEWLPTEFDDDNVTAGFRGKHWLGDHVGVGITYVDEERAGQDYTIAGGDLTLQAGKGTYLKAEYSQTESFGAPVFFSDNGGFTFTRSNSLAARREGEAKAVEGRVNLKELGWTELDWSMGAWWRDVGRGYSTGRYDSSRPITEYGAEILGQFSQALNIYARYSKAESGQDSLIQAQATLEWRIDDLSILSGELRRIAERRQEQDSTGVLGAVKYSRQFGTSLNLYGLAQLTLDDDGGRYEDNDALVLGGKYLFGDQSSVGGEISSGDRGDAVLLNAEYRISQEHSFYGGYTYSTDSTQYESLFNPNRQNGWTLGQRWRLTDQANLFNETQFIKEPGQSGLANTFGMDFYPAQGWNIGFTLQSGELTRTDGAVVDRRAVSLSGGLASTDADWQSKLEWRKDTGAEQRTQWVTTNRLVYKINESWRIAARINYSDTDDDRDPLAGARFIESNLGFAWRPWDSTRWGLFGRYTYLYDLATLAQQDGAQYDQRSQILSLEGVYKHDQHWEYALKAARRDGEVRLGRGSGAWFDSGTNFMAAQVRYEMRTQWHALAEYRWLDVDEGGSRQGFLIGLDRDLNKNFRIGVGYNFTDFSDDLTDFDYDHRGWFINMTGTY